MQRLFLFAFPLLLLCGALVLAEDGAPETPKDAKPEADEQSDEAEVALSTEAKNLLRRFDRDGDGKLSVNEVPPRLTRLFRRHDANNDGVLEGAELNSFAAALAEIRGRIQGGAQQGQMAESYEPDEDTGLYLQAAYDYHKLGNGKALYIMKDGEVIFEAYDRGFKKDEEHNLYSGTKSFVGILAACAVEDGLFGWDDNVSEVIHEWKEDIMRRRISVRMLLNLTAGLPPETGKLIGDEIDDKYAHSIGLECISMPGTRFSYGGTQFFAFGEYLKRVLAEQDEPESIREYFFRRFGDAIGLELTWETDAAGNYSLPHGMHMTAANWAKFGEFVRNGGKVGDKQVLKTEYMDECFKRSPRNPNYGLTWWLPDESAVVDQEADEPTEGANRPALPADLVIAAGLGKQLLYVSREAELTIVRFGDGGHFEHDEFFGWLMNGVSN
jgi:CubicO group peptidase (beta-lactamase class C family)